jgi:hypothetical protein
MTEDTVNDVEAFRSRRSAAWRRSRKTSGHERGPDDGAGGYRGTDSAGRGGGGFGTIRDYVFPFRQTGADPDGSSRL